MIDYEELYNKMQPVGKEMKAAAASAVRCQKAVSKDADNGNLISLKKNLETLDEAAKQLQNLVEVLKEEVESFDVRTYFADGDFTKQLLEACENRDIDVRGEMGVYEMFPYKVRITGDKENDGEVYIDRKKQASVRPVFVADTIKAGQEKLNKAKFNAQAFMDELADAYETTCLKTGARIGSTQKLDKIYKIMTPMSRARKEYDKQAYAFDLARIYEKGTDAWITKSGVRYYFGTSRDGKSGIRVLSSTGVESFINTLKLVQED